MNSSKGWGDQPAESNDVAALTLSKLAYRLSGVVLAIALLVFVGSLSWYLIGRASVKHLRLARDLIGQSLPDSSGTVNRRTAQQAVEHLRASGSQAGQSTKLLLAAALSLGWDGAVDPPGGLGTEIEDLLHGLAPEQCSTADLLLAMEAFSATGRLGEADWLSGHCLKRRDSRSQAYEITVSVRYNLGREEDVLSAAREWAELEPQSPLPWQWMSYVYEDRGYDEQLLKIYPKLVELDRDHASFYRLQLITRHLNLGHTETARQYYDELHAEFPAELDKEPLIRARLLHLEGQAEESLRIASEIAKSDKTNLDAMVLEGSLLLALGRTDEALTVLERVVASDPAFSTALYLLGQAHARAGHKDEADKFLAMHQRVLTTRVELHRLERLAGRNPHDRHVRLDIAALYKELGAQDQADYWTRAANAIMQ